MPTSWVSLRTFMYYFFLSQRIFEIYFVISTATWISKYFTTVIVQSVHQLLGRYTQVCYAQPTARRLQHSCGDLLLPRTRQLSDESSVIKFIQSHMHLEIADREHPTSLSFSCFSGSTYTVRTSCTNASAPSKRDIMPNEILIKPNGSVPLSSLHKS